MRSALVFGEGQVHEVHGLETERLRDYFAADRLAANFPQLQRHVHVAGQHHLAAAKHSMPTV